MTAQIQMFPNVFSIDAGEPFLPTLARAVLDGTLPLGSGKAPTTLDIASTTILLPTKRAARALGDAFLDQIGKKGAARGLILPRVRPIATTEDDLTLMRSADGALADGHIWDLPEAIPELDRRLVLTSLVSRWSDAMRGADHGLGPEASAGAGTPAHAVKLAAELASLMVLVETEGVSLSELKTLVPEEFSEHWGQTLQFLDILMLFWPAVLEERGAVSPADRRNKSLGMEAERLKQYPPPETFIIAGVTGSIPATRRLMQAVSRLPRGAIVLPALDRVLDAETFASLNEANVEHPQHGLAQLLAALGVDRANVRYLGPKEVGLRAKIITEVFRPAAGTPRWATFVTETSPTALADALKPLSLIETPTAQDEAETVALILREALEAPGRTAALVSPDRLLARRVQTRLESWGVRLDDSAGRPFGKTPPGVLFDLAIEAWATNFAPEDVVALIKHPLARFGLGAFEARRAGRALEIAALRAPYLGTGLDGLETALDAAAARAATGRASTKAAKRLWQEDWNAARDLVARLRAAFAPLTSLVDVDTPRTLADMTRTHVAVAEALCAVPPPDAAPDAEAPRNPLWDETAGEAAWMLFQGLTDETVATFPVGPRDYPDFYRSLISAETVRLTTPAHPRLSILGPFESRLQQPDVVVLGGLNDNTWPEVPDTGPWLNRPMRKALGLPAPEAQIGYAAHDFATLLAAPQVFMTRALKVDGVPSVPSRWLMRLSALLKGAGAVASLAPEKPWLAWARTRDAAPPRQPVKRPQPRPALILRPRQLSVTKVERWLANPYSIFASEILGLEALPQIGKDPDAALRGQIIHEALGKFAVDHPTALPPDIAVTFITYARAALSDTLIHPRVAAFWLPRLERFAQWFAEEEPKLRGHGGEVLAELAGTLVLTAPGGPFTLKARADRIDLAPDGVIILDYKTGAPPTQGRVMEGIAPQLPLEAAILQGGGFPQIAATTVAQLAYVAVTGAEPPGAVRRLKFDDLQGLIEEQVRKLSALIAAYDDETTPYTATRRPGFDAAYRYDDFAHLARIKEWHGEESED